MNWQYEPVGKPPVPTNHYRVVTFVCSWKHMTAKKRAARDSLQQTSSELISGVLGGKWGTFQTLVASRLRSGRSLNFRCDTRASLPAST